MLFTIHRQLVAGLLMVLFATSGAFAQERPGRQSYKDDNMIMRVSTSRPEGLEAFYSGRGFSKAAINEITKTCFVTSYVKNRTFDTLWLILEDWSFYTNDGTPIQRLRRDDWKQTWERIGLKRAHQSTFSWTQLPESRDLRADEHAGGNVAVPWQNSPFKLVATFRTGPDRSGEPRVITFENLQCRAE